MNKALSNKEHILKFCCPQSEVAFPLAEYQRRLQRVRENMAAANIDCLYVTNPDHICYLSGYQAEWFQEGGPKTWEATSGIAVHVNHEKFIHFENQDEYLLAQYTTHAVDLRIMDDHDITSGFIDFIVQELSAEGWLQGNMALEKYSYRPNPADSARMQSAFEAKGCDVVDGSDMVAKARKIKSPAELAAVRTAAQIGSVGLQAAIDHIQSGMTELDVYAEVVYAMAKAGGENPAITMPVVSGHKSACFHAMASRKVIMPGDIVNVDVCGVYNRYHANMCRTFAMGEPDKEVAKTIAHINGALAVAEQLIKPGYSIAVFLEQMKAYYAEHNLLQDQWWIGGYELGIAFPPDWVGSYYFDIYKDMGDDVFETGFVGNYEANFYLPQEAGLSAMIDTMIVADEDAKFQSTIPAELIIIE